MAIIAKDDGKVFQNPPADVHRAVCVDVVDLGMVETEFKGNKKDQHKIRVVWELDALMDDGRPFIASRKFTLSLYEGSNLRPFLETWRGQPFTKEELKGFDVERLLGKSCMLQIQHNEYNGKVYANVVSVIRIPKGVEPLKPTGKYIRVKDRAPETEKASPQDHLQHAGEDMEEELPF